MFQFTDRVWERAYPWISGAVAATLAALFVRIGTYDRAVAHLTESLVALSGIAFGFLLTFAALLVSMERSGAIQELRDIDAYPVLLGYLKSSLYAWGAVAIVTILMALVETRLVDPIFHKPWLHWLGSLNAGLLTAGMLTSHRVVVLLFKLLRAPERRRQRQRDAA